MSEAPLTEHEAAAVRAVCLANLRGQVLEPDQYGHALGSALVKLTRLARGEDASPGTPATALLTTLRSNDR